MFDYNRQRQLQVTPKWVSHNTSSHACKVWVKKNQNDGAPRSNEAGQCWMKNVNQVSLIMKF